MVVVSQSLVVVVENAGCVDFFSTASPCPAFSEHVIHSAIH